MAEKGLVKGIAIGLAASGMIAVGVDQADIELPILNAKAGLEMKAVRDSLHEIEVAEHQAVRYDRIEYDSLGVPDTINPRLVTVPAYKKRIKDKWNPGNEFLTQAGKSYRVSLSDAETDSVYLSNVYFPGDSCNFVVKVQFPFVGTTDTTGVE